MCLKGFTFHRRVYGPYRLKGPLMRKGWKEWMDAGSPELTPDTKRKYKFDSRFLDDMLARVLGYGLHLCGQGDDHHCHAVQR